MDRPLSIDHVLPWGRSFDEYCRMFALRPVDLAGKRILDCAGGPASFNAELTARGGAVVSADPLYSLSADQIRARIDSARRRILENTRRNMDAYRWETIPSIEALERLRRDAMMRFLEDYRKGTDQGRYRPEALPSLPFADRSFDLVLCSHFLFTYSETLSLDFHLHAVREMARVAGEVRIFPLLDMNGTPSPYHAPLVERLQTEGLHCIPRVVPYEFQRGGDTMLRVLH